MSASTPARTPGRNDPCPCGSGKKYKHCHGANAGAAPRVAAAPGLGQGIEQRFAQAYHLFQQGAFAQAGQICADILGHKPSHIHANHLLGLCRYQEGNYERALPCLERAVKLDPTDPDAQSNLAMTLGRLDRPQDAEPHARRAVELNPRAVAPLSTLGKILVDLGNFTEAGSLLEQALAQDGNDPDALSSYGDLMLAQNRLEDAKTAYERALAVAPDRVQVLNDLGLALQGLKDYEGAQGLFRRVLQLSPKDADATYNLGRVAAELGDVEGARTWYRKTLDADAGYAKAYTALAQLAGQRGDNTRAGYWLESGMVACPADANLRRQLAVRYAGEQEFLRAYEQIAEAERLEGESAALELVRAEVYEAHHKPEEAAAAYERARELNPSNPALLVRFADFEDKRNRYDAAAELAAQALTLDPSTTTRAQLLAARAARRQRDYERADAELDAIDFASLPESEQASAWYELGNLRDAQKRYAEAFDAYSRGAKAAIRADDLKFDLEGALADLRRRREILTPDVLKRLERFEGGPGEKGTPIFIVGFMRSGTTLTEQILSSHPSVQAGDELRAVQRIQTQLVEKLGKPYPDCLPLLQGESGQTLLAELRDAYLENVRNTGVDVDRGGYFTDKMPLNLLSAPLISMVFPESPIIHLRRNPMDCGFSNFVSNFGAVSPWAYNLEHIASYYRGVLELADYYKQHLPMRYHEVRYEELVDNPEPVIRELAEFVGLPWDDAMLRFYENKRVARTPSHAQVNQPIYKRSVERWRHYEQFLARPLEILEPLMRRTGYLDGEN